MRTLTVAKSTTWFRKASFVALLTSLTVIGVMPAPFAHSAHGSGDIPWCDPVHADIVGTPGPDVIYGTNNEDGDAILGLGGADVIYGGAGDDVLCGGDGNDRLYGQGDSDSLFGRKGDDRLYGGPAFDDGDTLAGNKGDDQLYGGGGGWPDTAWYRAANGPVTVNLAEGVGAGEGHDVLVGLEGVFGSRFDDRIIDGCDGLGGDLVGGDGNDYLRVCGYNEAVAGGNGDDTIKMMPTASSDLGILDGPGDDTILGSNEGDDLALDFPGASGEGSDRVYGFGGNDYIYVIDGVSGNDVADAGRGKFDFCVADQGDDVMGCESSG